MKRAGFNTGDVCKPSGKKRWTGSARRAAIWLGFAALMLLLPCSICAQSGYYFNIVGRPYDSVPEATELGFVDLATGDLHLEIPLGDAPQRGAMTTNVRLIYDGRIWQTVNNGTSQTWQPSNLSYYGFSSGGWNWTASDDAQGIGYYATLQYCNQNAYTAYYGPWTALNNDGTINFITAYTQQDFGCGNQNISSGSAYDQFSHGFYASVADYTNATVLDRSGISLSSTEDSNGNNFTNSSGNLVDTLARAPLSVSNSGLTYTLSVPNAEGSNSSYTVTFSNINVSTSFGVSGVTEYSGTIEVVTSIAFPDGTSYSFTYDSGTSPGHYGELTGVTLRTGGTMTYGWSNYADVYGSVIRWLTSRTYGGGTWSYSPSVISNCNSNQVGCQQKLTETKPSGDEAVYTFTVNNGDWNTEADYYSGSSALLRKVTTTWDFSSPCPDCSNGGTAYVRPIQVVTSMPGPGGTLNSQTQYSYDSPYYGDITAIKQWNYTTGGFGSTPDRETDYTYLNSSAYISANILNRVTSKSVYQSGVQEAQTLTSYDSTGLTSVTGVTHHDDTNYGSGNTVRGNPTVVQQWVSGSTYLTTTNYYDTTGQLLKTTDPAGNSISYSYADNFDGYAPPAPTNAYLTQVTLPISGTIEYTYYFGTGQKASVTDQNLQETIYQFNDPLNRPTETTLPGGAWTLTTYTGATETDTYQNTYAGSPSPSCSSCVHNETLLDEWARTEDQVLASDPAGATTVATSDDAQDRVTSKSNPYRSASDPTYGLESYAYDALDRQISDTHADNNVAYTYYGAGITSGGGISSPLCSGAGGYPSLSVDEAGHKQQTWTDVFGNPVEVDQEDSTGALSLATCYQHDALNDLTSVVQGGQTRSYSYDGLGRETVDSTPEAGTVDYYFTASGGGVCAGDTSKVCRRTDARGITTTYAYDGESRLTMKSYSDSTPTAYFVYDESSLTLGGNNYTMTNGKGRLTHTSIQTNGAFTIESYDPAGRVLDLWQCTPFNCINSPYWDMHYQYTSGGYVNDYVHPAGYTITNNISNDGRNEEIQSSLIDSTHPNEIVDMSYAPQGALDHITTGCAGTGCNKLRQNYDYNNRLDLVRLQLGTELNFSSIACWVYNYYPGVGNPTSCSIPSKGSNNDGNVVGTYYSDAANSSLSHTAAYGYDPTHRLTSAVATGNSAYKSGILFRSVRKYDVFAKPEHQRSLSSVLVQFFHQSDLEFRLHLRRFRGFDGRRRAHLPVRCRGSADFSG
jgi:YD repeat-containing protein